MTHPSTPRRRKPPSSNAVPSALFVPVGVADRNASYRQASDEEILATARALLARRVRRGVSFGSPRVVKEYLLHKYAPLDYEVFVMMALDNRHRLIEIVELFRGTIDGSACYPARSSRKPSNTRPRVWCLCTTTPVARAPKPSR